MQQHREAQDIADAVLDAEVRSGELMAKVPKKQGFASTIQDSAVQNTKTETIEAAGLNVKQVQRFQTMAAHPEDVEKVFSPAFSSDPHRQQLPRSALSMA